MRQQSVFYLSSRALLIPFVLAAAVCMIVLSSVASAQDCSDDPNNLMRNNDCSFDTDVSGWVPPSVSPRTGTFTHEPADGDDNGRVRMETSR